MTDQELYEKLKAEGETTFDYEAWLERILHVRECLRRNAEKYKEVLK